MKVVVNLEMDNEFNFVAGENNLVVKRMLEKRITVHPMSEIFNIIQTTYKKLASKTTEFLVIKTFMDVEQSKFKCGEAIPMMFKKMTQ